MPGQITGQLRERSGLTQRDIVLAFLLALDQLIQPGDRDQRILPFGYKPLRESDLTQFLFHLISQCLGSIAEPQIFAREHGYGLPDWLISGSEAPIFALLDRLTNPPSENWEDLSRELEQADLFEELYQLISSFEGQRAVAPVQAIRTMRDETILADGEVVSMAAPAALAARGPVQGSVTEIENRARSAITKYRDDRIDEIAWRLIRFDFPLVVTRRQKCGVLLGAEIHFGGQSAQATLKEADGVVELLDPEAVLKRWRPCTDAFAKALQQGTKAAINLLQDLGMPQDDLAQFIGPKLYLRGVLPPSEVDGQSIGLPLAIEILRHALDLPPSDWVASGGIDESGEIHSLEPSDLSAKWEAIRSDGVKRGLLAVGHPDHDVPRDQLCLIEEGNSTLFQAAATLWGKEWDRKIRDIQSKALRPFGFARGWGLNGQADYAAMSGVPIIVETEQAKEIFEFFCGREPNFGFLGGRPKSGKTSIARQVQKALESTGDWYVDTLSMLPDAQPSTIDVIAAIQRASNLAPRQQRRLVILDGLEWNERLDGLEHALRNEAERTKISIFCIARWHASAEWITEDCTTFRPIQGEDAIKALVDNAFSQYPAMEKARILSGTIARYARGDLWWNFHLLALAAEIEPQLSYEELVKRFLERCFHLRSQNELTALKTIATLSWCSAYVPEDQIPNTLRGGLQAIGARLISERGWIIDSRATCDALLSATLNDHQLTISLEAAGHLLPQHIEGVLRRSIELGDIHSVLVTLRRVKQHSPALLAHIWRLLQDQIRNWAERIGSPVQLATLLDMLASHLGEKDLRKLVHRLTELVSIDWDRLDTFSLAICIRVLRRERAFADESSGESRGDGAGGWHKLMEELELDGFGKVVKRTDKSTDKLILLEELWRTHDDCAHHALAKHADRIVPDRPPYSAYDYKLALRLVDIMKNIAFRHETRQSRDAFNYVKSACENIANWEFAKEPGPTIDQMLRRFALRQELGLDNEDWERGALGKNIGQDLRNSINCSTLPQLCTGLTALANVNRPFAIKILRTIDIGGQLSRRSFSAGEVATLLGTVTQLHTETAYQILYDPSGKPRRHVAEKLARRIQATGDAKGAGRVLYAGTKIDELFGTVNGGFARLLAEIIGQEFLELNLRREPRVSVLFYLIQGLIATEVPFSDDAWHMVCKVVTETIKESLRPWAPQLALLMCESEQIGARFTEELIKRIPANRIFAGMTDSHSIEALESFHRLGRFYPGLAARFQRFKRESDILPRLSREDRPDVVLRAIRAIGDTLRRAGVKRAGSDILEILDKKAKVKALRNSPSGDVATTLHLWRQIDTSDAANIVQWESTKAILLHKLKRTTTEPHLGVDLLMSAEQAKQGCGSELLRNFMRQDGTWTAFVNELAHDQNPVTQGAAFLQLCRLGVQPEWRVCETLYHKVWRSRIERITSPRALTSLLKLFAAWDMQWGIEAAGLINIPRIVHRVDQACRVDLDSLAGLIGTMHALGQRESARQLADALGEIEQLEKRASLETWQFLLPVLTIVHRDLASELGMRLAIRLNSAANNHFIIDDEGFWRTLGWIAYYCLHSSQDRGSVFITEPPPSFLIPKDAGARLWATAWLADAEWASAARDRAWQEIIRDPWTCAFDMRLPALVAMSHLGRLDLVLSQVGFQWCDTSLAHPALLTVLLRASLNDRELARRIGARSKDIRDKLDQPYNRADLFTDEARRLLLCIDPDPTVSVAA